MARSLIHEQIIQNSTAICDWFKAQTAQLAYPIYSSYDIRDSGYKVTNVDANIFPAGFNNICPTDKETSIGLVRAYVEKHYGNEYKKILLVTEEHTNNGFYWENVSTLVSLFEQAGMKVKIAIPSPIPEAIQVTSATGKIFRVISADFSSAEIKEFNPDLIVSNNDFSQAFEEWAESVTLPMNPPREMGWYQRKKSRYFQFYNNLADEFSKIAGIDPFLLRVETEEFQHFDINNEESRNALAARVDEFIAKLKIEYTQRGIQQEPFVFVKNNSGTYGLAVIKVNSGEEVKAWTYKSRKKMKAAKGGRDVEEVIIQEGIPSIVTAGESSAEPVIYMVGCELAGGFLRTHAEKSATESLNSPGAVYKKLCVSDLSINAGGCPQENVYGWSAKLGLLAIAYEAREMQVTFQKYKKAPCGSI